MAIVLPHTFHDGTLEVASGVQVMDDLETLKRAIEQLWTGGTSFAMTPGNGTPGDVGAPSWGRIKGSDGSILGSSGDFTCTRLSAGKYEVKWTNERPNDRYAVVLAPIAGADAESPYPGVVTTTGRGGKSFLVEWAKGTPTTGPTLVDWDFSFIALGQRVPNIVLPRVFKDGVGEVASGKQVMEDLETLASALLKGFAGVNDRSGAVSWGNISEAAGINGGSGDFTVTKQMAAEGRYRVTWNTERASANYAVVLGLGAGAAELNTYFYRVLAQTTAYFEVQILDYLHAASTNYPFQFIAVGGATQTVSLPYTFTDGTSMVGIGAQAMANLNAVREAIEKGWAGGKWYGGPSWDNRLANDGADADGVSPYSSHDLGATNENAGFAAPTSPYKWYWKSARASANYACVYSNMNSSQAFIDVKTQTTTALQALHRRALHFGGERISVDSADTGFIAIGAG